MNVLFVSVFPLEYNTSATIRNKGVIQGLHDLGYSIDTLTIKPENTFIVFDNGINDLDHLIQNKYYIDSSSIYRKFMATKPNTENENTIDKLKPSKLKSKIKKILLSLMVFDTQALSVTNKKIKEVASTMNVEKYDLIISSSDPKSSHLLAKRLLELYPTQKIPWIQFWGDPMFNDITIDIHGMDF